MSFNFGSRDFAGLNPRVQEYFRNQISQGNINQAGFDEIFPSNSSGMGNVRMPGGGQGNTTFGPNQVWPGHSNTPGGGGWISPDWTMLNPQNPNSPFFVGSGGASSQTGTGTANRGTGGNITRSGPGGSSAGQFGLNTDTYNLLSGLNTGFGLNTDTHNLLSGLSTGFGLDQDSQNILRGLSTGFGLNEGSQDILKGLGTGFGLNENTYNLLSGLGEGFGLNQGSQDILKGLGEGFGFNPGSQRILEGLSTGLGLDPGADELLRDLSLGLSPEDSHTLKNLQIGGLDEFGNILDRFSTSLTGVGDAFEQGFGLNPQTADILEGLDPGLFVELLGLGSEGDLSKYFQTDKGEGITADQPLMFPGDGTGPQDGSFTADAPSPLDFSEFNLSEEDLAGLTAAERAAKEDRFGTMDMPGIPDNIADLEEPLLNMLLGNVGSQEMLGEEFVRALGMDNPFAAGKEGILGEIEGKLRRQTDRELDNVVNRFSATNKLGVPLFRDSMAGTLQEGLLDRMADARIGFGLEEARAAEGIRRNRLSDLQGFNQNIINNLSQGLNQQVGRRTGEVALQQSIFQNNLDNFLNLLNQERQAIAFPQGLQDEGLRLFLGSQGAQLTPGQALGGLSAGLGNAINAPNNNPWAALANVSGQLLNS